MNGKTTIPTKAWKDEYTKLTAEKKTLNQRYLALKEEVKEAEKIRKSVYSILRQEQRCSRFPLSTSFAVWRYAPLTAAISEVRKENGVMTK